MQILDLSDSRLSAIDRFNSVGASSQKLVSGTGASHVYHLNFTPGGEIGRHPTGYCQLFIVIRGSGWAAGEDDVRQPIDLNIVPISSVARCTRKGLRRVCARSWFRSMKCSSSCFGLAVWPRPCRIRARVE